MKLRTLNNTSFAALLTASLAMPAFFFAQAVTTDIGTLDQETAEKAFPAKPPYSPYAGRNFPTRPFFGDTHTHTSFSMDAGAFGARLGPKAAYRFAKGEEVIASSGQRAKLSRPLDFLVVSDHSDGMGFFPQLISGDPTLLGTPQGRKWYDEINSGKGAQAAVDIVTSLVETRCRKVSQHRGPRPIAALGARQSRRRMRPMSRAVSLPSSATSGLQTLGETTFIAMSSGATTEQRQISSNLSPRCRRWAVQILATSGSGWRWLRRKPAPKFLPLRTTEI